MSVSIFATVKMAPRDPILGLTESFNADSRDGKVNLGVGMYYDDSGHIPLLEVVHAAEKTRAAQALSRSYQPIDGPPVYNTAVQHLLFGAESEAVTSKRTVTVQTLGGTGALRIGGDYLQRLNPNAVVYLSDPSWANHRGVFQACGFEVRDYRYYDPATRGVDFAGMKADLETLEPGSIVVLHACCHNPTGADLDAEQWQVVVKLCRERQLIPFLDIAYQGFAEGLDADAATVRLFADSGLQCFIASSFSKNFSLYGERVGALSVVTGNSDEADCVLSQIKQIIRTNYSSPPTHGGAIITTVLGSSELAQQWTAELTHMRERIHTMRAQLVERLAECGAGQDFSFITSQRGMFSYTGLSREQVDRLRDEHGIYSVASGRICLAALNSSNLDYVARSIAAVTA